jgi:uncharacterized protein YjcR
MSNNYHSPKRRRGAQPGNLNALKHGFYARQFHQAELNDLDQLVSSGLQDEIAMLRLIIRRVVQLAAQAESLDQLLRLLNTLSHATANLGRLMKIQYALTGGRTDFDRDLEDILFELNKEWGLDIAS